MKNIYGEDNLIVWQKWFDPFGADDEIDNGQDFDDKEDFEDFQDQTNLTRHSSMRAIATPMGLIPYTENTASSKIFNFWVGHTNFTVHQEIKDIIENIDGVETLDVFTRYRFRIAIGKSFDAAKVMKELNDQVYEYLNGNKLQ